MDLENPEENPEFIGKTINQLRDTFVKFGLRFSEALSRIDFKILALDQQKFCQELILSKMDDEKRIESQLKEIKRLKKVHQQQTLDFIETHRKDKCRLQSQIKELKKKNKFLPEDQEPKETFSDVLKRFRAKQAARKEFFKKFREENGLANTD